MPRWRSRPNVTGLDWLHTPNANLKTVDDQVERLARCLVLGTLLAEVQERFGGFDLVAHWTQGEFHHDVVLRLPEAAASGSTPASFSRPMPEASSVPSIAKGRKAAAGNRPLRAGPAARRHRSALRALTRSNHSSEKSSARVRSRSPRKSRVTRTVDVSSYETRRKPLSSSS